MIMSLAMAGKPSAFRVSLSALAGKLGRSLIPSKGIAHELRF